MFHVKHCPQRSFRIDIPGETKSMLPGVDMDLKFKACAAPDIDQLVAIGIETHFVRDELAGYLKANRPFGRRSRRPA
jgi:hypothetical protein